MYLQTEEGHITNNDGIPHRGGRPSVPERRRDVQAVLRPPPSQPSLPIGLSRLARVGFRGGASSFVIPPARGPIGGVLARGAGTSALGHHPRIHQERLN